jgi:hypothetical protein
VVVEEGSALALKAFDQVGEWQRPVQLGRPTSQQLCEQYASEAFRLRAILCVERRSVRTGAGDPHGSKKRPVLSLLK